MRVIFRLPKLLGDFKQPSPSWWNVEEPLAYVIWFSRFKANPDPYNKMYAVDRAKDSPEKIQGAVIPLANIRQCCMLSPATKDWDASWDSHSVLDQGKRFFVNNFQSQYTYGTIY